MANLPLILGFDEVHVVDTPKSLDAHGRRLVEAIEDLDLVSGSFGNRTARVQRLRQLDGLLAGHRQLGVRTGRGIAPVTDLGQHGIQAALEEFRLALVEGLHVVQGRAFDLLAVLLGDGVLISADEQGQGGQGQQEEGFVHVVTPG